MKDLTTTYIIMSIVILHIIAGFGYLMYKMSPKKKDDNEDDSSKDNN